MNLRLLLILLVFCSSVGAPFPIWSQEASAADAGAPSNEDTEEKVAYVRCWLMIPTEVAPERKGAVGAFSTPLSISVLRPGGVVESLVGGGYPYQTTGYFPVKPGAVRIIATKNAANKDRVEAIQPVTLRKGNFYTVIATGNSSDPLLEIIDDSAMTGINLKVKDPTAATNVQPTLFARNFLDSVTFVAGGQPVSGVDTSAIRPFTTLTPRKFIRVEIIDGGKKSANDLEVDYSTVRSYSAILVRDLYGRAACAIVPNCHLD